jgi:hypothetical protein
MQWTGIWNHWQLVNAALVEPDFDSQLKACLEGCLGHFPFLNARARAEAGNIDQ